MKRIALISLLMSVTLCISAEGYITNSRVAECDRRDNLDGYYGVLLLSKQADLVVNCENAVLEFEVEKRGLNADMDYEYYVIFNPSNEENHDNLKLKVNR